MSAASAAFDVHALRAAYGSFLGAAQGRILLTGHSHQAWPDASRDAMALAFDDAARFVDDKWHRAVIPRGERLGARVLERLGFEQTDAIAFAGSTHELVYRLLSCFARDARVVTTTGEFHSLHRQLSRLEEEGLRVAWVPKPPRETLADRLLEAIVPGVDLVAVCAVLFEDAFVLPRLREISDAAHAAGATLLIDAYHAFNVVPLQLGSLPAERRVFVTAGGYKYAAFGEGVCLLRIPAAASCARRTPAGSPTLRRSRRRAAWRRRGHRSRTAPVARASRARPSIPSRSTAPRRRSTCSTALGSTRPRCACSAWPRPSASPAVWSPAGSSCCRRARLTSAAASSRRASPARARSRPGCVSAACSSTPAATGCGSVRRRTCSTSEIDRGVDAVLEAIAAS